VKNAAAKKPKSEAELIHQATCNLLKAIKRKMKKIIGTLAFPDDVMLSWTLIQ